MKGLFWFVCLFLTINSTVVCIQEKAMAGTEEYDFGDMSSSTLTTDAWLAFQDKNYDTSYVYADKCIELYEEQARDMQGSMIDFAPKGSEFSCWALNDVGTCYYIKGLGLKYQGKFEEAKTMFNVLMNGFSYAQCWDPKGWFWKPAQAARIQLRWIELAQKGCSNNIQAVFDITSINKIIISHIEGIIKTKVTFSSWKSVDKNSSTLSYLWDFGDGAIGEGQEPFHVYEKAGTYTITLFANNSNNEVNTASNSIVVAEATPEQDLYTTWYLAEGCTKGFEEWILVQNPNNTTAHTKITFMRSQGLPPVSFEQDIEPKSRWSCKVNEKLPNEDVSAKVECTNGLGIIAERAMYPIVADGERVPDGHCSIGSPRLYSSWYLAEGCTKGFEEWVLIQNPNNITAHIVVTFMRSNNLPPIQFSDDVAPNSRYSLNVNKFVPDEDVSVRVETSPGIGIVVERAMYWNNMTGSHCSIGVPSPEATWYLAEGCTKGFEEWVLVQNPWDTPVHIRLTFMRDGNLPPVVVEKDINPNSRNTFLVNQYVPDESVSTKVECTSGFGIIAERAMYWDSDGIRWIGGHNSIGVTESNPIWYLAEGCTSGFEEWVLIQNPNGETAHVKLTFMRSNDLPSVIYEIDIGPNSRWSYRVNDILPNESVSTKIECTNELGIIAERAMYWDSNGVKWVGGHSSCGVY